MFRWGVLSTAKIGWEHVLPAIADSENGVLSAIASRSPDQAATLAARFAIPNVFDDYHALLASDLVDGVYIPLPNAMHVEWTRRAIEAGKHVLCEKPLALKAEEIDTLIAARDAKNRERGGRSGAPGDGQNTPLVVAEAFMVRHHPQWAKVQALLASGAIGRLRCVQGAFSFYNDDPTNIRNIPAMGGGALLDIGVYPIVTTRFATGAEPKRVRGLVERHAAFGTDTFSHALIEFDGFHLSFYLSTQLAARQQMTFHGDRGFINVTAPFNAGVYGGERIELHAADHAEEQVFTFNDARQYRRLVEDVAAAAMGADRPYVDLENSRANQRVVDAVFRAGDVDGWVDV